MNKAMTSIVAIGVGAAAYRMMGSRKNMMSGRGIRKAGKRLAKAMF